MASKNLTALSVEKITPPQPHGQIDIFDKSFPGLSLRVSYGGRKAWSFVYRHGGKVRRMQLGTYPALSLAEARERLAHSQTASRARPGPNGVATPRGGRHARGGHGRMAGARPRQE